MCVYKEKKIKSVFNKNLLMELTKKTTTKKEETINIGQAHSNLWVLKNYIFIFLSAGTW